MNSDDPIEVISGLASLVGEKQAGVLDAVVFKNFEALDDRTAASLFGRIRALLESPEKPLGKLGIVLLGHSLEALDPEGNRPVSTLRSLSELYTPTVLDFNELKLLAGLVGDPDALNVQKLRRWSGGEPLLVQAILLLIQSGASPVSVESAIEILAESPPAAFESWMAMLKSQMRLRPAVERIVGRLLKKGYWKHDRFESRTTLAELFINNWVVLERDTQQWVFRSECRELLARRSFSSRRIDWNGNREGTAAV